MAIYRKGTASMTANGVVTGVGTNWQDALSLIRVGATIVFLTSPLSLATVSSIVSPTELRVINSESAVVSAGTNYVILLHDSITVDGLAQDVAETLRYYQGQESQIAEALEFFKNFDLDDLKAEIQKAHDAATAAEASKTAAETAKTEAEAAKADAEAAKAGADSAKADAETAKAGAESAKSEADTAKTDAEAARDEAKGYADSISPDLLLKKADNLSDLADRAEAWMNVRPTGSTPIAADAVNDYDAPTLRQVRNMVGAGTAGPTMNGVMNYGVGESTLWLSRAYIPPYALPEDGQIVNRADWPELWAHAQQHGAIADSVWVADPTKRAMYSTGDGSTTFRMRDLNGVQKNGVNGFTGPDSILSLFGRGDQGSAAGTVLSNGAPDITGIVDIRGFRYNGQNYADVVAVNGAFTNDGLVSDSSQAVKAGDTGGGQPVKSRFSFSAKKSNAIYGSAAEVRPNTFFGVWITRASGGFVAANTSWSVSNGDATLPGAGTQANGGNVVSDYRVAGAVEASLSAQIIAHIGSIYRGRVSVYNKTKGTTTDFDFRDDGGATFGGKDVIRVGDFGFGATLSAGSSNPINPASSAQPGPTGFGYWSASDNIGAFPGQWQSIIQMGVGGATYSQMAVTCLNTPRAAIRSSNGSGGFTGWAEFYSTSNTTKASDGTLKAASPIVKLFHDGGAELNAESDGCVVTRLSVGEYLIEGCRGLNSDAAWGGIDGGFDIPTDRNKQPLIWLDFNVNADGSVLVKTYHRTHPGSPSFARNDKDGYENGDPIDIPNDQFVSVRVEM